MDPNFTSAKRRALNKSRRSMHHTRPALPIGTCENARRVRQMARGAVLST